MRAFSWLGGARGRGHDRFVTLVVALSGALLVAVLWRFNPMARGYEFYLTGNAMALFFAPMLLILFLFHEEPGDFGFAIADSRRVRWLVAILYAGLLFLLVPISRLDVFQQHYPLFRGWVPFHGSAFDETNRWDLLYGWASYAMYMFFWEFFFRGYLLFGLARTIRWPAVIVQAIPFCLLHVGKPMPEVAASFGAGVILGIVALRAKSFLPGFVLHTAAFITFDALVLAFRH